MNIPCLVKGRVQRAPLEPSVICPIANTKLRATRHTKSASHLSTLIPGYFQIMISTSPHPFDLLPFPCEEMVLTVPQIKFKAISRVGLRPWQSTLRAMAISRVEGVDDFKLVNLTSVMDSYRHISCRGSLDYSALEDPYFKFGRRF